MNALKVAPDNKLTLEATRRRTDSGKSEIEIKVNSNCSMVSEEVSLLEATTFTFFLQKFARVVPEDRESLIKQYLSNLDIQLHKALKANQ